MKKATSAWKQHHFWTKKQQWRTNVSVNRRCVTCWGTSWRSCGRRSQHASPWCSPSDPDTPPDVSLWGWEIPNVTINTGMGTAQYINRPLIPDCASFPFHILPHLNRFCFLHETMWYFCILDNYFAFYHWWLEVSVIIWHPTTSLSKAQEAATALTEVAITGHCMQNSCILPTFSSNKDLNFYLVHSDFLWKHWFRC